MRDLRELLVQCFDWNYLVGIVLMQRMISIYDINEGN